MKKLHLSLNQRKQLAGVFFSLPFILGFLFFFLYPFIQAIIFSLSELQLSSEGYSLNFNGIANYYHILFVHVDFIPLFLQEIEEMIVDLPLILFFSFFSAVVLNQKFRGRAVSRAIFFLPVIMAAGIIFRLEQHDYITEVMQQAQQGGYAFSGQALREFLIQVRLPESVLNYILEAVERIPEIVRSSGIQILIFLAGLQSIPGSMYEAARVEGATPWESFWMITLPMLSPLIMTNIVYTIVDSFTAGGNDLVEMIRSTSIGGAGYGIGMAMSIIYFMTIMVILVITIKIISGWVFYNE
ncbi:MAG: carbohydrate ABC transporter permease [Halanaerobiaceae bacterium]